MAARAPSQEEEAAGQLADRATDRLGMLVYWLLHLADIASTALAALAGRDAVSAAL